MSSSTAVKAPEHPLNQGNTSSWAPRPTLVAVLTGDTDSEHFDPSISLEDAMAAAQERLNVMTLQQRAAAGLRAALKVAGARRVTANAHNRKHRDSANGQAIQRRVFAAAGA